ncbi:PBY1 [Candida pseudojiufengensis]|uniref:PBY1 n=1 Tax=Candida pseudojiufengensis TaxID=497109 RepID=UPI00222449BC|nr:PBY1 [Candida pseudojiufengensis]KAI5961364.1 PBY1 [Candida pseudojiufengensis]
MHVLLTNDDGPISDQTCPYMKYFVDEITTETDWDISIVIPDQPRSWSSKSHLPGKPVVATYIYTKYSTYKPNPDINKFEGPFDHPQQKYISDPNYQEWCLVSSTPAACADIGIHHLYRHSKKKPVDLVISGPNFGKNSTSLYILASGTVGAAMEAVTHGTKAIGLSYAFISLDHDFKILKEAAKISVKLIKKLYKNLQNNQDVDLYSVNVPLVDSLKLGKTKIEYAPILQNKWGSIYEPTQEPNEKGQLEFKWAPDFKRVWKDGLKDQEHTDSRVLLSEGISVTPLKACFRTLDDIVGEIKLDDDSEGIESDKASNFKESGNTFLITIPEDSYLYEPLVEPFEKLNYSITSNTKSIPSNQKIFHYGEYEDLDLEKISQNDSNYYIPSYIYRKALIRKHYLANTIHHYITKHPDSILAKAVPENYQLEIDYAEFLDDSLDESYELREAIEAGDKVWIVKPSMSDKGQGISIFRTVDQLQAIFDAFDNDDDDEEGENESKKDSQKGNGLILSHLRHFIVQEYISSPLLLPNYDNKKFHLRTYVICQGDLKVFVYKNILTLFADEKYQAPHSINDSPIELNGHLTNTCLQEDSNPLVVPFWNLENMTDEQKSQIFKQICEITKELFKAATSIDKLNFQPLTNAIEIFGIDFLVDSNEKVYVLEVNSYPDFKQTGDDLKELIYKLFDVTINEIIHPMITGHKIEEYGKDIVQVL